MRKALLALLLLASPAAALNEGLQCVPYARALTGVEIRGDAHTWWGQAEGRYDRGQRPKAGAVMAFIPHGNMRLGHVAAVRKVLDRRTLLISHANWSTIDGVRGHIEEDVRVVDVSDDNDWSRVRVWYTPNGALGSTEWPVHGFIYPERQRSWGEARNALASLLGGQMVRPERVTSVPVKMTQAAPARSAAKTSGFTLSARLLTDLEKVASKEKRRAS